ncbi:MAG: YggT family protein [Azoarcus sp.]|jgi:YggT family protein|nr:YggT family protein [Azoarcus sp.]
MLTEILILVVNMLSSFITLALLARFFMQWTRLSFRNPVGHFVIAVTNWVVMPLRRFIPGLFGLDMASLLPAWVVQMLYFSIEAALGGAPFGVLSGAPLFGLFGLALMAAYLLFGTVLFAALSSWFGPHAPMALVFGELARPFLAPFRRLIPPFGGVDLSPLALLLALQIAMVILERAKGHTLALFLAP